MLSGHRWASGCPSVPTFPGDEVSRSLGVAPPGPGASILLRKFSSACVGGIGPPSGAPGLRFSFQSCRVVLASDRALFSSLLLSASSERFASRTGALSLRVWPRSRSGHLVRRFCALAGARGFGTAPRRPFSHRSRPVQRPFSCVSAGNAPFLEDCPPCPRVSLGPPPPCSLVRLKPRPVGRFSSAPSAPRLSSACRTPAF